jgi:peptidyl-prolyl cis-trans isomerase SurA
VQQDVEQAYYMSKMEPAIRDYLNKMRDDGAIFIKPGYIDSGATYAESHPSISFSSYVPPAPKKKAKAERTRFRESTHGFRQKSSAAPALADQAPAAPVPPAAAPAKKKNKNTQQATEKPGKKEKIRFGQAPRETLPTATTNTATENAGALPETASNADQPANPLEPAPPTKKTRFSDHAREPKIKTAAPGATGANGPDAGEVADRQVQSAPLGGNDATTKKKKKTATTTAEKTRLSQQPKMPTDETQKPAQQPTPIPPVAGAPAPADRPDQTQGSQPQQ